MIRYGSVGWITCICTRKVHGNGLPKMGSPLLKQLIIVWVIICLQLGTDGAAISTLATWDDGNKINVEWAYDFFSTKGTKKVWAVDVWHIAVQLKHSFILWLDAKSKFQTRNKPDYLDIDKTYFFYADWWTKQMLICFLLAHLACMYGNTYEDC